MFTPNKIFLKKTLCYTISFILAGVCNSFKPIYAAELGVNYNGLSRKFTKSDLDRSGTKWARVFIDVTRLMRNNSDIISDPDVIGFLKIRDSGYKVILNLKYDYSNETTTDYFPTNPNSQEFKQLQSFTTRLLDIVYNKSDIIVSGNEPYIESHPENRGKELVLFYKQITNLIIQYNKSRRNLPIYVGAFNNLQTSYMQNTPSVTDFINFAKSTPDIAGIDLHPHVYSLDDINNAATWARSKLGNEKDMIATEFSLVSYFKSHLSDSIDPSFANEYNISKDWKIYQYINYAIENPRPRTEWVNFLKSNHWFMNVRNFLEDANRLFNSKKISIATYAFIQNQKELDSGTPPWILNALYCNKTCLPDPQTGLSSFNYQWMDSFKRIQLNESGVIFFEHINYDGWKSNQIKKGNYSWIPSDIRNDQVSSLKIPSGWTVELYEHINFGGKMCKFSSDTPWVGYNCNDIMSSFKIYDSQQLSK